MRKKFTFFSLLALFILITPSFASATEGDNLQDNELTIVETQTHTLNGETFDVEIWKDGEDVDIYTVSTEVNNPDAVYDYVDDLHKSKIDPLEGDTVQYDEEGNVIQGPKFNWSRSLSNTDRSGKSAWSTSGYSEVSILYPITGDKMRVNNGKINANFTGSGNADKMLLNYSYTFSAVNLVISIPPSLTRNDKTVSWKSKTIPKTRYASANSLWAEGYSRGILQNTQVRGGSEVYKGSTVYRPDMYSKINFETLSY